MSRCLPFHRLCNPDHGAPYMSEEPVAVRRSSQLRHRDSSSTANGTRRVSVPSRKEFTDGSPSSKGSLWTNSEPNSPVMSSHSHGAAQYQFEYQQRINAILDKRSNSRPLAVSPAGQPTYSVQITGSATPSRPEASLPSHHPARVVQQNASRPRAQPPARANPSHRNMFQDPRATAVGVQAMPLSHLQRSMSPVSVLSASSVPYATQTPVELPAELPGGFQEKEVISDPISPSIRSMSSRETFTATTPSAIPTFPHGLSPVVELPGSMPKPEAPDAFMVCELPGDMPSVSEADAGPLPPVELPASSASR